MKVTVYDGKYHSVDSSETSFKMAGSIGFREALAKAGPVLSSRSHGSRSPCRRVPRATCSGISNSRRGRVLGTETGEGDEQIVIAIVPTSEVMRYATDLRSLTGGRGRFSIRHDRYEVVPSQLVDRIVKAAQTEP